MSRGLMGAPGFMGPSKRAAWRECPGDVTRLIEAARAEHEAGRLSNAWKGYQDALHRWLLWQWGLVVHDKREFKEHGPVSCARRLRRNGLLDRWTVGMIERLARRPNHLTWLQVDTLAGFVVSVTLEHDRAPAAV